MNDNPENPAPAADDPTPERVNKPRPALVAVGGRPVAIIPRTFEDAYRIGSAAVVGKWAPYGWTKEQATLAILHGAEVGLPPMMSLQKICVINGRPSLWGDAVPAIALATGQLEDWSEGIRGEGEEMTAYCTVKRRGIKTPMETTFSVADARRAGLWDERPIVAKNVYDKKKGAKVWKEDAENDSPWYRHPKRMLQMRARRAFRDAFADAFSGLYIAEELQDAPEMRDVTPSQPVIHNPLQDDAEVDGREPGDEVPPKQVAEVIAEHTSRVLGVGIKTPAELDPGDGAELTTSEAVTPVQEATSNGRTAGSIPATGAIDKEMIRALEADGEKLRAMTGEDHGPHFVAEDPVAETPQAKPPRQRRSKATDEPSPEPAPEATAPEKPALTSLPADWRPLGAKEWAKRTATEYLDYLRRWTFEMGKAGGGPTYAVELRNRFVAERDVRNNLGTPLDAKQLDEAKKIAADAYKQLGGQ